MNCTQRLGRVCFAMQIATQDTYCVFAFACIFTDESNNTDSIETVSETV